MAIQRHCLKIGRSDLDLLEGCGEGIVSMQTSYIIQLYMLSVQIWYNTFGLGTSEERCSSFAGLLELKSVAWSPTLGTRSVSDRQGWT